MGIKCFFIEPINETNLSLRRYCCSENGPKCVGPYGYHNADVYIGVAPLDAVEERALIKFAGDPRWPTKCQCGYTFADSDNWQVSTDYRYKRSDTGEVKGLREWQQIPGCIWNSEWLTDFEHGPDGMALYCICPGGHQWGIDGRASNCDSPCSVCGMPYHSHKDKGHSYKDVKPHQCWIRHGTPPNITVDKNGVTCNAGAGSILTPNWHGFLRNGEFVG